MRHLLTLGLLCLAGWTGCPARQAPAPSSPPPIAEKPKPTPIYSTLTGVELDPTAAKYSDTEKVVELLVQEIADATKRAKPCRRIEAYAIKSVPPFRQINAIAGRMLADAKEIGWSTDKRFELPDKSILFPMEWHGVGVYMLFKLEPQFAGVLFCESGGYGPPSN